MAVKKALAYGAVVLITAVKRFIVQASGLERVGLTF